MIGFSDLTAFASVAVIAAPDPSISFQSVRPYSSTAALAAFIIPAPGSMPIISYFTCSPIDFTAALLPVFPLLPLVFPALPELPQADSISITTKLIIIYKLVFFLIN
ncbi:hypothetical protein D3C77_621530 [compost metagenome]